MKVLIEADQGKITSDVSFAGYIGAHALNENDEVKLLSLAGLSIELAIKRESKVLPIGSVEFVKKASELVGIDLPNPLNVPLSLIPYLERKVWNQKAFELNVFPCFVKPLEEVKRFTGFVIKSKGDLENIIELKDWNGMLFCSEPIHNIVSEWRCYVVNGTVYNCSCYRGDALIFPDKKTILELVSKYEDAPVGYSLDVAVTNEGTVLIECNDAWALGYYGGEFAEYFKMVKSRWLEILSKQ